MVPTSSGTTVSRQKAGSTQNTSGNSISTGTRRAASCARTLRRLEAMMAVADKDVSLVLTGTGDVLEPEDGLIEGLPGRGASHHRRQLGLERLRDSGTDVGQG